MGIVIVSPAAGVVVSLDFLFLVGCERTVSGVVSVDWVEDVLLFLL